MPSAASPIREGNDNVLKIHPSAEIAKTQKKFREQTKKIDFRIFFLYCFADIFNFYFNILFYFRNFIYNKLNFLHIYWYFFI